MKSALATHWPEYLMEAAGLGIFMLSAGGFGIVLFHPASPIVSAVADSLLRRFLMGCAMGLTAVCLIYSPWGQQSGACTLTRPSRSPFSGSVRSPRRTPSSTWRL